MRQARVLWEERERRCAEIPALEIPSRDREGGLFPVQYPSGGPVHRLIDVYHRGRTWH